MIWITEHAVLRAKERLGINKKSLDRLATKAYTKGICHADTKGTLNKYITSIWVQKKNCNNIRIFGEHLFLFSDNVLVTLYVIPSDLKRYVKFYKSKHNK